jgi:hypothetical protein
VAAPSRPATFKGYGVKPRCYGCGRKLTLSEHLWFTGYPKAGVFGECCFKVAARWGVRDAIQNV